MVSDSSHPTPSKFTHWFALMTSSGPVMYCSNIASVFYQYRRSWSITWRIEKKIYRKWTSINHARIRSGKEHPLNVNRTFPMLCRLRRVDMTYRMFTVSTLDSIKRRRGKVASFQSRSAFVRSKSCRIFAASRVFAEIIANLRICGYAFRWRLVRREF